jgi:hypothetical protein
MTAPSSLTPGRHTGSDADAEETLTLTRPAALAPLARFVAANADNGSARYPLDCRDALALILYVKQLEELLGGKPVTP